MWRWYSSSSVVNWKKNLRKASVEAARAIVKVKWRGRVNILSGKIIINFKFLSVVWSFVRSLERENLNSIRMLPPHFTSYESSRKEKKIVEWIDEKGEGLEMSTQRWERQTVMQIEYWDSCNHRISVIGAYLGCWTHKLLLTASIVILSSPNASWHLQQRALEKLTTRISTWIVARIVA